MFCHFSARSRRSGTAWMHSYLGREVGRIIEAIQTDSNRWNMLKPTPWTELNTIETWILNNLVSVIWGKWEVWKETFKKATSMISMSFYVYALCLCTWCSHCHCSHWAHGHRLTKALGTSLGDRPREFSKRIELPKFVKCYSIMCMDVQTNVYNLWIYDMHNVYIHTYVCTYIYIQLQY